MEVKGPLIDVDFVDGKKIFHTTNRRPDGTSEIAFKPSQVGNYAINIEFNNKPMTGTFKYIYKVRILGSPFQVNVVDPTKVLIDPQYLNMEDGSLRLIAGQRNIISVDATAAGPGIF